MNKFKAVFWDIDGVVVISEPLHVEKITKTAQKYNIILTNKDWDELYGIGDHRVYKELVKKGLPISEDDFIDQCLDYYVDNKDRLSVRDGFKLAFNHFAQANMFQATVSSGVKEQVKANLDAADAKLTMEFNLSATDIVDRGLETKPSADPYLEALRQLNEKYGLNIKPEECLVVEDSGSGVKAGHAAGMHAIHWRPDTTHKTSPVASSDAYDKQSFLNTIQKLTK